jgi:hypothetical protein
LGAGFTRKLGHHAYMLKTGRIEMEGEGIALLEDPRG